LPICQTICLLLLTAQAKQFKYGVLLTVATSKRSRVRLYLWPCGQTARSCRAMATTSRCGLKCTQKKEGMSCWASRLPMDLLGTILTFMPVRNARSVRAVCRMWQKCRGVWQLLYITDVVEISLLKATVQPSVCSRSERVALRCEVRNEDLAHIAHLTNLTGTGS